MSGYRDRQRSLSYGPPSDTDVVSYFQRAAAAEQGSIRRLSQQHPRRYRLVSQLDKRVIHTVLRYARGRHNKCTRKPCKRPITLTDALRQLQACEACRTKNAINSRRNRSKGKVAEKAKLLVKVRYPWLYTHPVLISFPQKRAKAKARSLTPSAEFHGSDVVAEDLLTYDDVIVRATFAALVHLLIATQDRVGAHTNDVDVSGS